MQNTRLDNWAGGANNIAQPSRIPEGQARRLVNFDPADGGTLELRQGFELAISSPGVRAMFSLGKTLVYAAGSQLIAYSPESGASTVLSSIDPGGPVAGAELNGKLYIRTHSERLVYDGDSLKRWGSDNPGATISITSGSLPAGVYKVAVTAEVDGNESGADVMVVRLEEESGISVSASASGDLYCYMTPANASTLYLAGRMRGGSLTLSAGPAADSRQLATGGMIPMPIVSMLSRVSSMLVGAQGKYLYHTDPMRPHLVDQATGFVQFDGDVVLMAPVGRTGLFVATGERTYLLDGIGTEQSTQTTVADHGAVAGTAVQLPDGSASWFCEYGQVIGTPSGEIAILNKGRYSPRKAERGAAGLQEHNGQQSIVTALRGSRPNSLSVGDSWSVEVTDER